VTPGSLVLNTDGVGPEDAMLFLCRADRGSAVVNHRAPRQVTIRCHRLATWDAMAGSLQMFAIAPIGSLRPRYVKVEN